MAKRRRARQHPGGLWRLAIPDTCVDNEANSQGVDPMLMRTDRRGFMPGLVGAGAAVALRIALADPCSVLEALVPAAPKSPEKPCCLVLSRAHVHENVKIDNVMDPAHRKAIERFFP